MPRRAFRYTSAAPRGPQPSGASRPLRPLWLTQRAGRSPGTCRSDLGSGGRLEDPRHDFSNGAVPESRRNSLAAIVDEILRVGVLAGVRFVQRDNASGGVVLTGACPTVGTEQRVGYTAEYILYR